MRTMLQFQSTPPRGKRRRAWSPPTCSFGSFQSTPPRGKRRAESRDISHRTPIVSIHAPAREATRARKPCAGTLADGVSIHAPAREATFPRRPMQVPTATCLFQSTPPRGKRLAEVVRTGPEEDRRSFNPRPRAGSDATAPPCWTPTLRFNPRPRAGSDSGKPAPAMVLVFQSTPPAREATSGRCAVPAANEGFNPRPRAGSDLHRARSTRPTLDRAVSIHAPRGKRFGVADVHGPRFVFQSTPPRGKRLCHRNSLRDSRKLMSLREHDSVTSVADHLPSRGSGSVALQRTERGVAACANRPGSDVSA